jgi:hypothetical protein
MQISDDSEAKQNYPQPSLVLICHSEFCSSQILGPKKNIPGPETIMEISKMNIRIVSTIRILNESNYEVDELLAQFGE